MPVYGTICFLVGFSVHLILTRIKKKKHSSLHVVAYTGPSMTAYACPSHIEALLRVAKIVRDEREAGHQLKQLNIDIPLWQDQHGHQVSVIEIVG